MSETLALSRIPLDQYAELLGASEIEELRALAKPLRSRSIEMINSTAVGGGVAEILNRLVPLAEELEINIKWDVMMAARIFLRLPSPSTMPCTARRITPARRISKFFSLTANAI